MRQELDERMASARLLTWTVATVTRVNQVSPHDVPALLREWWQVWLQHPDCERVYQALDRPGEEYIPSPWAPYVAGVFEHPPGIAGHTESYIIATIQDIMAREKWGKRSFGGPLVRFQAVDLEVTGLSPWLITSYSWSYHGSMGPMTARLALKAFLPKALKRYVGLCRKFGNKTYRWWSNTPRYKKVPRAYRQKGKQALWYERYMPQAHQELLQRFISLDDFFAVCTGKVHPEKVPSLVAHQGVLIGEGFAPLPRSTPARSGQRGRRPTPVAEGQPPLL